MASTRALTYTQPLKGFCPVKRGFGQIGGACGLGGGIGLGVVYLAPTSPSLEWCASFFFVFFFCWGIERRGVEGQRGLWFLGERGLEVFQMVPFCFQRKLHLCKCALCPLVYCLNSIVDFLWEAHWGLGGPEGTKGGSA